MPLSDSSQTCTRAVRPEPSPAVLPDVRRRHLRGLPVLVYEVSRRAWGLRLRRTNKGSRYRHCPCCLPHMLTASASGLYIFTAQSPTPPILCLRFAVHLAMPNAKLGAKVDRYSFFVRLLPPLLHTGLARRTNIPITFIDA